MRTAVLNRPSGGAGVPLSGSKRFLLTSHIFFRFECSLLLFFIVAFCARALSMLDA